MSCQITLNLIWYLPAELNWGPITTTLRHLEKWRRILKYSECFLMLTEFVKSILLKPSEIVGWNNTGKEEIRLLRPEVLLASVLWEDPASIAQAKQLLQNHLNNSSAVISPNLREVKCFPTPTAQKPLTANQSKSILDFRLFTLAPSYPENINIGNFVGLNTQHSAAHQKHLLKGYSCFERWERPKMLGKHFPILPMLDVI